VFRGPDGDRTEAASRQVQAQLAAREIVADVPGEDDVS